MLEILGIIYLCNKNAANAIARGRKPGGFIALTLILWLGMEIIGIVIGSAAGMELGTYILALGFAVIGGMISYSIAKNCKQGDYIPPVQKTLNEIKQNAQPLSTPAQLTIVRDGSMVGAAMSYAIMLNGTPVGTLKNNSSITITTNQQQNILQATDAYGNQLRPYIFDLNSGALAEIHFKAGKFLPELSQGILPSTAGSKSDSAAVSNIQPSRVLYCPACGRQLETDARFCANCGRAAYASAANCNIVSNDNTYSAKKGTPISLRLPADPMRAVWTAAVMFGVWVLLFLFRFLGIAYFITNANAAGAFEDIFLGIGLFMLLQKETKYKLYAAGTFIMQAFITMTNMAIIITQSNFKYMTFSNLVKMSNQPMVWSALQYALIVILILTGIGLLVHYLFRNADAQKRFMGTV